MTNDKNTKGTSPKGEQSPKGEKTTRDDDDNVTYHRADWRSCCSWNVSIPMLSSWTSTKPLDPYPGLPPYPEPPPYPYNTEVCK